MEANQLHKDASQEKSEEFAKIAQLLKKNGYECIKRIGEGSFGAVYLVRSIKYDEEYVCKRIKVPATPFSEVNTLKSLNHPHVIAMFDTFCDDGYIYIIFEFCPGGNLADYVKAHGPLKGSLMQSISKQIFDAIYFCHKKHIAHLDIKPANLLLDKYGRIKLADFGLSTFISPDVSSKDPTKIMYFNGSPLYMAPEVLMRQPYDPFKADIWSLGVTLYFLATGTVPWFETTRNSLIKQTSEGVNRILPINDSELCNVIFKTLKPLIVERADVDKLRNMKYFAGEQQGQIQSQQQPLQSQQLQHANTANLSFNSSGNDTVSAPVMINKGMPLGQYRSDLGNRKSTKLLTLRSLLSKPTATKVGRRGSMALTVNNFDFLKV